MRCVADPAQTTYGSEDYFIKALTLPEGEIWVSRLSGWYVSREEQRQGQVFQGVIRFAMPVYRHGQLRGVVVLSLDHRHLMEFTQHNDPTTAADVISPSYESGNYAFMFDDQGWTITHPKNWDIRGYDRDGTLVPAYSKTTSAADISSGRLPFNLFHAGFVHPNYPKVAEAVRQGSSGVLDTTNIGGAHKIMAFAPIIYRQGAYRESGVFGGITIGSEVDQFHLPAERAAGLIRDEINRYLWRSWLVISLTVLFIIAAAYLFSESIVRPLKSLTAWTKDMIDGSAAYVQLDEQGYDEVADLADSFNRMIRELNGRRERLLQTLRALRQSRRDIIRERNFKNAVFENIETGLITFDRDCVVTSVNGPACTILNIERQEAGGDWQQTFSDWPELSQVLRDWFDSCRNGVEGAFRTYVPLTRNERSLTYRLALFPLSFRQQQGWLLTVEDLTERVNMRHQMARMERLASLGRMSAGIAHEVRNPLTGVSLLLDELHDRLIGQQVDQGLIRRALGEIERLEALVNEMLRFATLPAVELKQGQLEDIVESSLFLMRKQCERQNVVLVKRVHADLPPVRFDADRIKQVLLNLFNNSLDAMPDGGSLTIELTAVGHDLQLAISDTGVGIPADNLPLIFEPFFTDKGQGTGLGLAISYNIITDHGGEIWIDSQVGCGTTVTIRMPGCETEVAADSDLQ